jgi:hypothetical protein
MSFKRKILTFFALFTAGFIAGINCAILRPNDYEAAWWKVALAMTMALLFAFDKSETTATPTQEEQKWKQ